MASKRIIIRESLLGFPIARLGKGGVLQHAKRRHQATSVPLTRHVERVCARQEAERLQRAQDRQADRTKVGVTGGIGGVKVVERVAKLRRT